MSFDYEQSIWGAGEASLRWSSPTSFRLRQALNAIASLKAGAKVLEVGCGAGQFIRAIKKIRPELDCHGADISKQAIARAQKNNDNVTYTVSEGYYFPYEAEAFDAVLIFDVLEHVEHPDQLLKEVNRVLKSGGILFAFVPCEGDWLSLWHLFDIVHLKKDLTRRHAGHVQFFSRRTLFNLVNAENFTFTRVRYSEHFLGQLLGVVAFRLMERGVRRRGLLQINNEVYFGQQSTNRGITKKIKNIINSLVSLESALLSRVPSPNVHLTATKSSRFK